MKGETRKMFCVRFVDPVCLTQSPLWALTGPPCRLPCHVSQQATAMLDITKHAYDRLQPEAWGCLTTRNSQREPHVNLALPLCSALPTDPIVAYSAARDSLKAACTATHHPYEYGHRPRCSLPISNVVVNNASISTSKSSTKPVGWPSASGAMPTPLE